MPTFLLSSIHHEHFEAQGGRLGWKHYFKQAYTQALDKRKVILHLLAEHNLNADETIFIGDMVHDIETARHAGVLSCAVLTGYDSLQKLKARTPISLFRNLREVREFLRPAPGRGHASAHRHGRRADLQSAGPGLDDPDPQMEPQVGHPRRQNQTEREVGRRLAPRDHGGDRTEAKRHPFELVQDCIEPPEFYKKCHFLLLNYTATSESTSVTLNDEAENYQWLSPDEAAKLDLNGPTRVLLDYVRSHPRR